MKTPVAALLVAFATVGCYGGPPPPMAIYIDPAVPPAAVMAGAAMWGEFVPATQVFGQNLANVWVFADNSPCGDWIDGEAEHLGWVDDGIKVTLHMSCFPRAAIEHDFDYVMTRWISAHEFGHALGLSHDDAGPAVMNRWVTPDKAGPSITDVDREQFRRLYPAAN